jgi:hypothetical protein
MRNTGRKVGRLHSAKATGHDISIERHFIKPKIYPSYLLGTLILGGRVDLPQPV